jgi:hypothetical protein
LIGKIGLQLAADAHQHDGDVVGSAPAKHRIQQSLARRLRAIGGDGFEDFGIFHMCGQPIRAEHEHVAWQLLALMEIDCDFLADADGAGDDVTPRPAARLGRADHALVEELLHFRVVARNLRNPAVADQVDAAVARPEAGEAAVHREQRGNRRADGDAARPGDAADLLMGTAEAVFEPGEQFRSGACDADGRQMLHDGRRGDLAGLVSAHAVGDKPEPAPRLHEKAVLVEEADAAAMADAVAFKGKGGIAQIASWRPSGAGKSRFPSSVTFCHNGR